MAVPAQTASAIATTSGNLIALKGNREDLENAIYNISPRKTPFMNGIGRGNCDATLHEWQMHKLATAAANKQIEGDNATADAPTVTQRLKNSTTISRKVASVSNTQERVNKAGRDSEMAFQMATKSAELKRDIEFMLCGNGQKIPGTDSVPGSFAAFETWIYDDQRSNGAGGADTAGLSATVNQPNDSAGPTDGTARLLEESFLKTVLAALFDSGGEPTMAIANGRNKQRMSTFAGNSNRQDSGEDKSVTAAVDIYRGDFGDLRFVASNFIETRSSVNSRVMVVDPTLWSLDYLRTFNQFDLARTGDSRQKMIVCEYTLTAKNPTGSGLVADVTANGS